MAGRIGAAGMRSGWLIWSAQGDWAEAFQHANPDINMMGENGSSQEQKCRIP